MGKRRTNGEGAVYQTKDGRWRAAVDLGWKDGKRERKYLSAPTKAGIAKKVRDALAQVEAGVPLSRDGRGPLVEEWLWYWFDNVQHAGFVPAHEKISERTSGFTWCRYSVGCGCATCRRSASKSWK